MASNRAVALALATLHEAYPTRAVTEQTAEVWRRIFAGVDDAAFLAACDRAAVERGRTFFPTPGEISGYIAPAAVVDADAILKRISALGSYNPNVGWIYPRIDAVREALGESIARAYADAGASRCFAADDAGGGSVTRDIARRAFATGLAARDATAIPVVSPPAPVARLTNPATTEDA